MLTGMIGRRMAGSMGQHFLFAIAALLVILIAGPVQAVPLNLTLFDSPDIMSGFIDVTYDAEDKQFLADGFALELDDDGVGDPFQIQDGTINIIATIDNSGMLISGTVEYGGSIEGLGFTTGTLLTGELTAFGFREEGGDPLEFLFDVTGGDAAGFFGPLAGIILSNTNFGGSFASDFDNLIDSQAGTGSGVNDGGVPVPEPATALFLGSGLIWLAGFRRKFKK